MLDWLREHGKEIGNLAEGGIWILIVGFGLLRSLFGAAKKRGTEQRNPAPAPKSQPNPSPETRRSFPLPTFDPVEGPLVMTSTQEPQAPRRSPAAQRSTTTFGGGFDRPIASDEDATLKWGSAFDKNNGDGYGTSWKSVFDEDRNEVKWGFDANEWGGGYARKKAAEPTISVS